MTIAPKCREFAPPLSLTPRGLRRIEAAGYIGVSPSKFDEMVREGTMPKPKRVGARVIWDRYSVDECFTALPSGDDEPKRNMWDEMA
jgi:predicted DNA-binding transcriptional regulator AlpA